VSDRFAKCHIAVVIDAPRKYLGQP
jgi:hypothetical protein